MKKLYLALLPVIIFLLLILYSSNPSVPTHYHAGFLVYVDGVKQDFTDYQYMNFTPCTTHAAQKTPAEQKLELAHLHDGVGDVVHVHRGGAVWGDLFQNLDYSFSPDTTLKGYLDGQLVPDILQEPILANQSVIIVAGSVENIDLQSPVTLTRIQAVEAQSELCGGET